jgi:hypothetical protein
MGRKSMYKSANRLVFRLDDGTEESNHGELNRKLTKSTGMNLVVATFYKKLPYAE